jgi:hypothetical protein
LLLFDIGTAIGAAALLITFLVSAISNTRKLYALEPLPKEEGNIFLALSRKPA